MTNTYYREHLALYAQNIEQYRNKSQELATRANALRTTLLSEVRAAGIDLHLPFSLKTSPLSPVEKTPAPPKR